MDLTLSPEQSAVVDAAASFLAREMPMDRIRALLETPSLPPKDVWAACGELGWFGLGLPESQGGVGYGLGEEALLFRELGRYLAPGPFLATVLGGHVAAVAGLAELASSIMGGATVVGLADLRPDGRWDLIDASDASIVLEVEPGGARLFSVDDLTEITVEACIDDATRLATAAGDRITPIAVVAGAALHQRGTVLVAAMLAGIAEATRDRAVAYAKVREQYGQPIGAYQAIKHPCADMAVRAEAAGAQALFAAVCVGEGRADAGFQASAAKVVAADAAIRNAAATVQIHGGIGFTFECDAHLFVKRAHVLDQLLGDSRAHLDLLLASEPVQ
jgi:alkylation response protein AidB-like acyl-CoA dehydrogenase